jgi:DNA invertase Pin-like site-specific DNA recombinase
MHSSRRLKEARPTQEDRRKVVGYIRVSTGEQALGPQAQRAALQWWCAAHQCNLVAVYADHGVSGAVPADQRYGLTAALHALRRRGAGVLLVASRDRLARDTLVAALVERQVVEFGAAILTADGSGNADSPEGILLRRIVDAFAEFERQSIRARTKAALAIKRARRERISREPPYGWRLSCDGKHIEPDPQEQAAVALARRLRRSGISLRRIGHRLTQRGYTPRKAKCWHPQTITSITNRVRNLDAHHSR